MRRGISLSHPTHRTEQFLPLLIAEPPDWPDFSSINSAQFITTVPRYLPTYTINLKASSQLDILFFFQPTIPCHPKWPLLHPHYALSTAPSFASYHLDQSSPHHAHLFTPAFEIPFLPAPRRQHHKTPAPTPLPRPSPIFDLSACMPPYSSVITPVWVWMKRSVFA